MLRELLRGQGVAIYGEAAGALRALTGADAEEWAWQSVHGNSEASTSPHEVSPSLILLFVESDAAEDLVNAMWRMVATRWPLRPARVVRLEGVRNDPGSTVHLLKQQPVLVDLLPARLLSPDKTDGDPLFASDVNAITRLGWLGARMQRLAEVAGIAPARGNSPPTWQYRCWWSGAEGKLSVPEEPRTSVWSFLDPIVLVTGGTVGPEARAWNARLEQFRAFG